MESTKSVAALGRPFAPGMLYDCRNDSLIPGITLWNKKELETNLKSQPQSSAKFEILTSDSIQDKANALDISAELKLSVMGGLVDLSGSGSFFQDHTSNTETSRVTLQYKTMKKFVSLSMEQLGNPSYTEVFNHQMATHVCTGVEYGADAFLVFELNITDDASKHKIHGELQAAVNGLVEGMPSTIRTLNDAPAHSSAFTALGMPRYALGMARHAVTFSVEGAMSRLNLKEHETKVCDEDIACKFIGDFKPDRVPTNYTEAKLILENLPELMKNIAIPKRVHLYPLVKINNKAAQLVRSISESLVSRVQEIFQGYVGLMGESKSLQRKEMVREAEFLEEDVNRLYTACDLAFYMFKQDILLVLPKIRGGGSNEKELADILERWRKSKFSPTAMRKYLKTVTRDVDIVKMYTKQAKAAGIEVKLGDSIDDYAEFGSRVVAFKFNNESLKSKGLEDAYEYLQYKDFSSSCIAVVEPMDKIGVKKDLYSQFNLFLLYCKENDTAEDSDIKFAISNGSNCPLENLAYIELYEYGSQENFELPNKPGKPFCIKNSVSTTSVEVKLVHSKQGLDNVTESKLKVYEEGKLIKTIDVPISSANPYPIKDLHPSKTYSFQIQSVSQAGCSPDSDMSESVLLDAEERLALKIRANSTKVEDTNPTLDIYYPDNKLEDKVPTGQYRLNVIRVHLGNHTATKFPYAKEVTVMVVGATGTGKSTLLNSMINYAYGVRLDDDFRFKIVTQDLDGKESSKSRTKTVTAYSLYNTKLRDSNKAPYILTVVDTPGYGDTEGLSADKNTTKIIKELFETRPPKGITSLNAIILVVKSTDTRLTAHQRHNFNSVLALFGKDLSSSILIAATFCDAGDPPVKRSLADSKIMSRNFFKFNNSAVFAGPSDNALEQTGRVLFWKLGDASFEALFDEINMMREVSLQLSAEVLRKREGLEILVIQLESNVKLGMAKLDQMRTEGMQMAKFEAEIAANKDFTYTVMEPKIEQKKLACPGQNTTTCIQCSRTCHLSCAYEDDWRKRICCAMDWQGNCKICPGKCSWTIHKNTPFVFEVTYKSVTRTYDDLKAKYGDANKKFTDKESMMENLAEQFGGQQMEIAGIVKHIKESLAELKKIAHKPTFLTEPEYIDLLIEGEKMDHLPGWLMRVKLLQEQRQIAVQIQNAQDPNFDPFAEYKNQPAGGESGWRRFAREIGKPLGW